LCPTAHQICPGTEKFETGAIMKLNRSQIHAKAREILEAESGGIRWGALMSRIHAGDLETPQNSIHGALQNLFVISDDIVKVARGTYQLAKYVAAEDADASAQQAATDSVEVSAAIPGADALTEQDFYHSFAAWLEENDEATQAAALGGSSLGGKWGTPDVIGVLKPRAQDIFKFEPQIVTSGRLWASGRLPALLAQELYCCAEFHEQRRHEPAEVTVQHPRCWAGDIHLKQGSARLRGDRASGECRARYVLRQQYARASEGQRAEVAQQAVLKP
jgi:hypothetical protein